jgi:hypothetical protein
MNNIITKLKTYLFGPFEAEGESFKPGVKTILPNERIDSHFNSMTYGDRKRYFDNYNQNLLNRISDIKSKNS